MSLGYNSRLSPISDKGLCGDPEHRDTSRQLATKISHLCRLLRESKYAIAFTGAGISTSCGIPDFRGPRGVWTMEAKGQQLNESEYVSFESATPSIAHFGLRVLLEHGVLKYVISQNVDGLHLRSGLPRDCLSELHGNIFAERCLSCATEYVRDHDVGGMGCKPTGRVCDDRQCGGALVDQTIDWDTPLPESELKGAEDALRQCDLILCLGTSLRIKPAGNFPHQVLKRGGKVVIVNLQKTHMDKRSACRIFGECDAVVAAVVENMGGGAERVIQMWERHKEKMAKRVEKHEGNNRLEEESNGVKEKKSERETPSAAVRMAQTAGKRKADSDDVEEDDDRRNARKGKKEE